MAESKSIKPALLEAVHQAVVEELNRFFEGTSVDQWVKLRADSIARDVVERVRNSCDDYKPKQDPE